MIFGDYNLAKAGESIAHAIAEEVLDGLVVVFRKQNLTEEDEVRFCKMIGNVQEYVDQERTKHIACHPNILRVTGEKDSDGEPGLFGHTSALDWHANQASNPNRDPLIWLYSKKGSFGSRTSWINMIKAYDDLSETMKKDIQDVEITLGYKSGSYSTSNFFNEHHATDIPFKLVHTNDAGRTGLYFPFLQIFGMPGKTENEFNELMTELIEHVTQEKYVYHHDWIDGDVVISEQWLSIHKRWEFDKMDERVLHRIAFDYSRVKI